MQAKQQFNVYLDPDLIKEIKHLAIDQGCSLSDLVSQALKDFLADVNNAQH